MKDKFGKENKGKEKRKEYNIVLGTNIGERWVFRTLAW